MAMRRGNHSRTRDGNAGWLTATPTPIRKVAPKSTGVLGPSPRRAPNTATKPSPAINAPRTPNLAMSSAPGTDAIASNSTGSETRAPTAFSSRCSSRWMSGISGGTASIVSRRSMPPSSKRSSRTPSARVSLTYSPPHFVGRWREAPEGRWSWSSRILVPVPGLLIVTSAGPEDPTRASIPFHIAVNGARPNGTEVAIALAGDAAELVKPDVIANVLGLGLPPLRDLLDKCLDQDVPFYV